VGVERNLKNVLPQKCVEPQFSSSLMVDILAELFNEGTKTSDNRFSQSSDYQQSAEQYFEIATKALIQGFDWQDVVLEAIKVWHIPEERKGNHKFIYLILGEAFNWIRLATRIINACQIKASNKQINDFLFNGYIPANLSEYEFRSKIGDIKYKGWQNYYYGVMVEQCVVELSKSNMIKKAYASGVRITEQNLDSVFKETYGDYLDVLWRRFNLNNHKNNKKYYLPKTTGESDSEQFTYWLFKLRLSRSAPEVFASRTKEALKYLDNVKMNNNMRVINYRNQKFEGLIGDK